MFRAPLPFIRSPSSHNATKSQTGKVSGPAHAASAEARNPAIEKGAPWNGRDRVCARDKYKLEISGEERGPRIHDTKRQINTMTKYHSWILGGTRAPACRMSRGCCSLCSLCQCAQSPGTKWAAWPRDRLETKDFFVDPSISVHPNSANT